MVDIFDILQLPISIMRFLNIYPALRTTKFYTMLTIKLYLLLFGGLEIVAILQYVNAQTNINTFVSNTEAVGGYAQVIGKLSFLVYNTDKFAALVNSTKCFWGTNRCSGSVKSKLDSIIFRTVRLEKLFLTLVTVTMIAICFTLLFGRPLVFGIWTLNGYENLRKMVMVSQLVGTTIMCPSVAAFDCAFLSFCISLIVQFRILSHCFEKLDVGSATSLETYADYRTKLKLYIKQHILLLRFTRHLQETYSFVLLYQYFTTVPLICADIYAVFEESNVQLLIRYIITMFSELLQLAFYCIPADYVVVEALKVSQAAYHSNWYSRHFLTLRNPLTLIIQRSEKQDPFLAGGLIVINSRTLLNVLRICWSICTLVRTIK